MGSLLLARPAGYSVPLCKSHSPLIISNDVPSLAATPTATVVEQVLDKEKDISKEVDQYVALAECLREKGIDIDDPTAATLDSWMGDLESAINWNDPAQIEIYETCSGGMVRKACWRTNHQYTKSHLAPVLCSIHDTFCRDSVGRLKGIDRHHTV